MTILITGAAGFIGAATCKALLSTSDHQIIAIDNLNDYYDVQLKQDRLASILNMVQQPQQFININLDIAQREPLLAIFKKYRPHKVIHLAAQAGVRYSLVNTVPYLQTNLIGFGNILDACKDNNIQHLVYASSSSVYGANESTPFSVHDNVDHPVSLYAATKKPNELMAHSYSHLYNLPTTGLRFFTVYGPWGRPDMALYLFTKAILAGDTINIFNNGRHQRDFTYIDDIVTSIIKILNKVAQPNPNWCGKDPDPGSSLAPWRLFNIGSHNPINLMDYIKVLEQQLGKTAKKTFIPLQPGDVANTYADVTDLIQYINYTPKTSIETGIANFISWYKEYNNVEVM